ncbi:cytochrome c nitrite reductase small subunit [bacterium]|nr:cytochrome c nitrite reductase small subunit [bacterium]
MAVIGMGVLAGAGGFTFFYARGTSYFLDDPRACKNCHVMRGQFDGWNRSSHHAVATCNSCHTPKNIVGKYATKAINGWNHSAAFTTGHFDENIEIHDFNAGIAHDNCVRCHEEVISRMTANAWPEKVDCVHCHGNVGHNNKF